MDFFGILFDMKNGKKIPYSKNYFDTFFAENLAGVTTLTGTLPLTFTTSETKLRSWTIYGADIEHIETASGKSITFYTDEDKLRDWTIYGNDSVGKNKLEITTTSQTINGVAFTVDKQAGTITANGTASAIVRFPISIVANGDFYFSCQMSSGSNITYYLYVYDRTAGANVKEWDGVTATQSIYDSEPYEVKIVDGHDTSAYIRIAAGYNAHNVVFKPMLRLSDTSADFEPYQIGIGQRTNNGYIVPLSVNGNTVNIPIGNAPLTAGQSISKTSTGVDIATADGNNTITTALYNQPDMSITYNEFTGVGILTANLFMIALQLKAGGQTLNVFNTLMNKPLRAGETLTSEQTGQTINTVAGVENKLLPAPKVASYGGSFNMTIKYKE